MKCSAFQHKLINHLENELSPEEQESVDAHLQQCDDCREAYNVMKQALNRIAVEKQVKAPAFLQDRIVQSIQKQQINNGSNKRLLKLQRIAAVLLAFIALVGGMALGTTLYNTSEQYAEPVIEEFYLEPGLSEFETFLLNK